MKKVLVLFFVLTVNCFGQNNRFWKTDAEIEGLKGKVKQIVENFDDEKNFDENGYFTSKSNLYWCLTIQKYKPFDFEKKTRQISIEINEKYETTDCSAGIISQYEYFGLPKSLKKNSKGENYYEINYNLNYKTSTDSDFKKMPYISDSKIKFIEEINMSGKMFVGKEIWFFDEKSRLIENLQVSYKLQLSSEKFIYKDDSNLPISREIYLDNILYSKENYEYEKVDKNGNWLKRISKFSYFGANNPPKEPITTNRKITYYDDSPVVK